MIALTAFVCFLAVLAIAATLYLVLAPSTNFLQARLAQLWRAGSPARRSAPFSQKQKQRLERALTDLGKLLPSSDKKASRTVRMMLRAGFRSPEAVKLQQGTEVLLPVAFVAAVYFSGAYQLNPLFIFAFAALAGFLLPDFWLSWRVKHRQSRLVIALPDALDLLVVCVEAGMGLDQAIFRVAQELRISYPELSDELQLVNLEMRVGRSRTDSLRELAVRTGVDDVKAFVTMLIQTDRFGTDLAQSLRIHSDNLRTKRRQRAEEAAAKTTVKMIPALVFLIFPAMFAVLLGPAVISIIRQFHIGGAQ
ncbi:MAG TPA: type II secretion system F family protein [Candidatus Acidoferrum sp.]|nr:type II secretion system F family protein [Candidatus Acidoferrum sp.]